MVADEAGERELPMLVTYLHKEKVCCSIHLSDSLTILVFEIVEAGQGTLVLYYGLMFVTAKLVAQSASPVALKNVVFFVATS